MDAIDSVDDHVDGATTLEEGHTRDAIQIEPPIASASSRSPDCFLPTTDYEQALQEIGSIVNSSNATFKHKLVGVIWKHLTVSSL